MSSPLPLPPCAQIVWFIFSIFFWGLVAYASTRFLQFFIFVSAGVITMRIRIMQRLLMDRFNVYLATKNMVTEERQYDEKNTIVLVTWEETLAARGESGGERDTGAVIGAPFSHPHHIHLAPAPPHSPCPLRSNPPSSQSSAGAPRG